MSGLHGAAVWVDVQVVVRAYGRGVCEPLEAR